MEYMARAAASRNTGSRSRLPRRDVAAENLAEQLHGLGPYGMKTLYRALDEPTT